MNITNSTTIQLRGKFIKQNPTEKEQNDTYEGNPIFVDLYHGYARLLCNKPASKVYISSIKRINLTEYILSFISNNMGDMMDVIPISISFVRADTVETLFDQNYISQVWVDHDNPRYCDHIIKTATVRKIMDKSYDLLIDEKSLYDTLWEDLLPSGTGIDSVYAYMEITLNEPVSLM